MTTLSTGIRFPAHFAWGVATSAPQIEGAAGEDGKGESTWDRFADRRGTGETPAVACDHYHRYRQDIALMKRCGVRHYRFSLAWPRIIPGGTGAVNEAGLDFYDALVDRMLAAGVTPWATLFHWDTPQPLEHRGGWCSRGIVDAFGAYADVVARRLGDRVKHWYTINETKCFTTLAFGPKADKAPGIRRSAQETHQAIHHANLAHGHAVRAIRAVCGSEARIGFAENLESYVPLTETEADIAAARKRFVTGNAKILGAIMTGSYDRSWLREVGADAPRVEAGDMEVIATPVDFVGLNVYTGRLVRAAPKGKDIVPFAPEHPAFCRGGWLKYLPRAMYWAVRNTHEVYGPRSIAITENGVGHLTEAPGEDGVVADTWRLEHMRAYLAELHRAIADGAPVDGYFAWSLMDNYEWSEGYGTRFGLWHTDYRTQRRTPKLSMRWYQQVMARNALV